MRKVKTILKKKAGRGAKGQISVRHQGGRVKRFLREIDFKRNKLDVWGRVESIEYDPNRNSDIARIVYQDGERRYILAPDGLKVGSKVISSDSAPIEVGCTLPISKIPVGTAIHNVEVRPGKGGQMVKSSGNVAVIQSREENYVVIKLPSGEVKKFRSECRATVGQVGNHEYRARVFRKAGIKRKMGIRPTVRGIAMHPGAHPHGGGEGRSGVGLKYPKTPYGKPAVGKTRKKKKYSDKLIITKRKPGKHSHR